MALRMTVYSPYDKKGLFGKDKGKKYYKGETWFSGSDARGDHTYYIKYDDMLYFWDDDVAIELSEKVDHREDCESGVIVYWHNKEGIHGRHPVRDIIYFMAHTIGAKQDFSAAELKAMYDLFDPVPLLIEPLTLGITDGEGDIELWRKLNV